MGSVDISVGSASPVSIAQAYGKGVVITNTGVYPVYLDDQTNVSAAVNDFVLRPNDRIEWASETPCWGICAPGFPSTLSISNNVAQFTAGSGLLGLANTGADVIYSGTFQALIAAALYLDVSAYASLRIAIQPAKGTSAIATLQNFSATKPPNLSVAWNADHSDQAWTGYFPGNYDDWIFRPGDWWGCQLIVDVKDSFIVPWQGFASFLTNYCTAGTQANLQAYVVTITGYQQRKPALCREYDSLNNPNMIDSRTYQWASGSLAVGTSLTEITLPLWSGPILVEWSEVYNAAPTTRGRWAFTDWDASNSSSAAFVPGDPYSNVPTRAWHGSQILRGGRSYKRINWNTGAGYVSCSLFIVATLYGTEDS